MRDAKPAPGRLGLVERFVNTVDFEHGREVLSSPERLRDVLELEPGIQIRPGDLRRAIEVREALRSLALANNGGGADPGAASVLEEAAARGCQIGRASCRERVESSVVAGALKRTEERSEG